jgi:hypothetical protein
MKHQVYFCTSQHFHPFQDPAKPLCLVWVAVEGRYDKVRSKVYRSYDFIQMMNLARQIATERNLKLAVLSTNILPELIYRLNEAVV